MSACEIHRRLADEGIRCGRTTVQRDIAELESKFLKPRSTSDLTLEHKVARVKFCRRVLRQSKREVIFSDEKYFDASINRGA